MKTLIFFVILNITVLTYCQIESDIYWIEHSIDKNPFKGIGNLNLRTIKQNQNQVQLQTYNSYNEDLHESDKPKFHNLQYATPIDNLVIDEEDKLRIKIASSQSDQTFYRLRLCKKVADLDCSVGTFTYLKDILEANFQINLTLITGTNNKISSIAIKTKPNNLQYSLNSLDHFTMFTTIQSIKQGQPPDSEAYLEKVKKEMELKEKAAQGGGESFIQKYWMYIVPFVVIMFLMNFANPEGAA